MMTPEDFKNIAQGFQALFVALAAIVGGIWVLLRFGITRERARAQLELERLRAETEGLKGVSGELALRHEEHEGRFFIYADATLVNHGSSALVYRCDDRPFHINRVTIENDDTWFDEVARLNIEDATSIPDMQSTFRVSVALLPNTPVRMSFHYVLKETGSYMFSLVLERDKVDDGKLARDKQELQKRWDIYKQHKDHPFYRENPKAELAFNRHYFVGRRTENEERRSQGSSA